MGRRKIAGIAAACLLAIAGGAAGSVRAANVDTPYIAEQAIGKAPKMEVYMTGSKMAESAKVSGTIESMNFIMDGDIVSFEESGKGISYIILMDNSGSVNNEQFDEAKNQLISLRKSLKEGDGMALYTVGTDSPWG